MIAIFTKFDALVKKCRAELPDNIKYTRDGKKKAEEEANNVFEREFLSRLNSKAFQPRGYIHLSGMNNFCYGNTVLILYKRYA